MQMQFMPEEDRHTDIAEVFLKDKNLDTPQV